MTSLAKRLDAGINRPRRIALNKPIFFCFQQFIQAGNCNVSDLRFELLSNVVEAVYPESSVCTVGTMQIPAVATTTDGSSMIFELKQFHIHASSEHSLDQEFFDAELHIVHQQRDNNNQLAVIGIFIVSDSEDDNLDFDQMLNEWEVEYSLMLDTCSNTRRQLSSTLRKTTTTTDDTSFNIYNLIPQGTSFYRYNGSLTTPPCSEIVDWSVAEIPLFISVHQYRKLMSIILNYRHSETCELASIASPSGTTSRPIQPLNQRHVQHICASSSSSTSQESGVEYTMAQSSAATNAATAGIVIICLVFVIVTMV
jgi:carbonic anhydrase